MGLQEDLDSKSKKLEALASSTKSLADRAKIVYRNAVEERLAQLGQRGFLTRPEATPILSFAQDHLRELEKATDRDEAVTEAKFVIDALSMALKIGKEKNDTKHIKEIEEMQSAVDTNLTKWGNTSEQKKTSTSQDPSLNSKNKTSFSNPKEAHLDQLANTLDTSEPIFKKQGAAPQSSLLQKFIDCIKNFFILTDKLTASVTKETENKLRL